MVDMTLPANLSVAVRRAERPVRLGALALTLPALLFVICTFVAPILSLLMTSVENREIPGTLPITLQTLSGWDGQSVPGEPVFAALAQDLIVAKKASTAALLGKRLNQELPGARSLIMSSARMAAGRIQGPWKDAFIKHDKAWGDTGIWTVIARNGSATTPYYLLAAVDLREDGTGSLTTMPEQQAIFLDVLGRTLFVALTVTVLTLVLGYPVAYVLTIAPQKVAAVMMLLVLLPLWTSLLVRSTAWVVMLQSNGVINDLLMGLHLTSDKLQLIFTRFGTVAAMTHIQLPFTILPIYSVMAAIPATHLRAARSLGAPPLAAFWRVYAPQTLPGVVAGSLMTFILSLGYYITPALVGGPRDQMISNFIATYINRDLNWSFAAALGVILLVVTLSIYLMFLKLVGADKIKLG